MHRSTYRELLARISGDTQRTPPTGDRWDRGGRSLARLIVNFANCAGGSRNGPTLPTPPRAGSNCVPAPQLECEAERPDSLHPPVDVLESLIACTKAGKAHTLLAEWQIAQEVCRDRWGVELKTLIRAVGRRSGAMLDVVDRARSILDEYENDAGVGEEEPALSEFRDLLEALP